MTILTIKTAKPYVEKVIQATLNGKDLRENITVGVKLYSGQDLEDIRKDYLSNVSMAKVLRWQKQLEQLPSNLTLSDTDFEEESTRLEGAISTWNANFSKHLMNFCKTHIAYFKNVSLTLTTEGKEVDLLIPDSRDAKPIESLWDTPEQALVVLLDMYLGHPAYKDSLTSIVPKLVFSTDYQDSGIKN